MPLLPIIFSNPIGSEKSFYGFKNHDTKFIVALMSIKVATEK